MPIEPPLRRLVEARSRQVAPTRNPAVAIGVQRLWPDEGSVAALRWSGSLVRRWTK